MAAKICVVMTAFAAVGRGAVEEALMLVQVRSEIVGSGHGVRLAKQSPLFGAATLHASADEDYDPDGEFVDADCGEEDCDDNVAIGSRTCIEDMCLEISDEQKAQDRLSEVHIHQFDETYHNLLSHGSHGRLDIGIVQKPACTATPAPHERVNLFAVAPAYHGSTALEEVLMSSPALSTPCACGSWQCEFQRLPAFIDKDSWEIDYNEVAEKASQCWSLNRSILFQKFMFRTSCLGVSDAHGGPECQAAEVWHLASNMKHAKIPNLMVQRGVHSMSLAFVLLWRPLCLARLSSHSQLALKQGRHAEVAVKETRILQQTAAMYSDLVGQGHSVLVVDLASLLWAEERSKARLLTFLPCLGEVNFGFVPTLGREIVKRNRFKANGSVRDFAKSVNTSSFYDIRARRCINLAAFMANNTDAERAAYSSAESFLVDVS